MKMTGEERNWVLYDVGNSAFVLLVLTILPLYFNYLAGNAGLSDTDYLAYWGYAASIATIIVAVMGPVVGTIAFFFYIDGVYTIIDMATAYGSALGLDSTGLLLALLVTQFVAFPSEIIFGAAFLGTTVVGVVTQVTGSMSKGVGMISVFFVVGIIFFNMAMKAESAGEAKPATKTDSVTKNSNVGDSYKYPIDIV